MHVAATTDAPRATRADTIVIGVCEGEGIAHDLPGGELTTLLESGEARSALKSVAVTHAEGRRWLVVGLGSREALDSEAARVAAALACARARELGCKVLCWEVPHHVGDEIVAGLVEGTLLRGYSFDRYKHPAADARPAIEQLILSAHHDVSRPVEVAAVLTVAQNRARDLGNMPANDLTPTALADYALEVAAHHERLRGSALSEQEIIEAGMGAFASVSQGSAQEARLIRLEYNGGAPEASARLALIGKGVTFDSGGLTLKPGATMHEMKFDMCGGAAVIEAIGALAELAVPVNVLGVVGATENLIGERAAKPGDIVTALDGTTIEIHNPDAEGRMVLADCITYARREGCDRLIDIATLTGAVTQALGTAYAGLFSTDDSLAAVIERSGARTGERVWRLPLDPYYAWQTKGRYADLTNRPEPREGLASAAAEMLRHFAGDLPWAHLDIAGMSDNVRSEYLHGKGATGFGVRLLVDVARQLAAGQGGV